jgi:hypothetical protein
MNIVKPSAILQNRWCGWLVLAAAALLVSPTISLGFLASTWRRAAVCSILSTAVAAAFYILFNHYSGVDHSSDGLAEMNGLFDQAVLWTTVVGATAPFLAGAFFRYGWERGDVRSAMLCAAGSFAILSFGTSIMTDRMSELEAATNFEAGKSAALASLNASIGEATDGRRDSPESWMAYFLSARVASELSGVPGPATVEDFRRATKARKGERPSAQLGIH